jgi:hypothetical protein
MSSIRVPDERTHYSSRRQDDVDALAWPVFSQRALDLLRSAGEGSVVISAVHSYLAGTKTS